MTVRCTRTALRQLERILASIEQQSPQYAETSRLGMRRFVATPYPSAVDERVGDKEIVFHGICHASGRPI